jgi:tetraacyldisaccharide 4'-kinase
MSAPRILLVSNGYGEMAILGDIASSIAAQDPAAVLAHMPLVGHLGPGTWPPAVGPHADMPSGGLVTYWNFRNIARDVRAGLLGVTVRQFAFLARQRSAYDVVVAVGDVFCAAACMLFVRRPTVFVATAKSEHVASHSPIECAIARRARHTFARDAATAEALRKHGVAATYAGNVMMDGVARTELELPLDPIAIHVAVLPGSRADAPVNARDAVRRLRRIASLAARPVQAFIALAPSIEPADVIATLSGDGVSPAPTGSATGVVASARIEGVEVALVRGGFSAVLHAADVVLGQAGTGNEQAAGLGKPVIAAASPGESVQSVGWYRMRQQKLLGDALLVVPSDDETFARETVQLLGDAQRMAAMGAAGRERMGGVGASAVVAIAVLALAKEDPR